MTVATKLSVKDIQLAIRNSPWCDLRSDIIVPNVSLGLLPYEADLIQVTLCYAKDVASSCFNI